MTPKSRLLFGIVTAIILGAALYLLQDSTEPEKNLLDFTYDCPNQSNFRVSFSSNFETATLFVADEKVALTQAIAASGIRYVGGDYEFWSKGDDAFLQRGGQTIMPDCRKR